MQIIYEEINDDLYERISQRYEWANEIHFGDGTYSLVAMDNNIPVGFISACTKKFTAPLENEEDAYINVLMVDKPYRRKGIARELILTTEKWATEKGFPQIRAWSTTARLEALPMWRSLGYCMCPAKIWLEQYNEAIDGYYVVKKLDPISPLKDAE